VVNIIDDKTIRIEKLTLGPYGTNAYIVVCRRTGESLVVDAPAQASEIIKHLEGTRPRYILLTHDHYDHTGVLISLRARLKIPLATHRESSHQLKTPPETLLNDGDAIKLGKLEINVLYTPGHTPGSLCFLTGKYLLAGDTIFPGGPGHTESPEDFGQILESITVKIFSLPGDTLILPGHGDGITINQARQEYTVFASHPHLADLCGDVLWMES
jgi:hydroxyacylglutathione hydrolase